MRYVLLVITILIATGCGGHRESTNTLYKSLPEFETTHQFGNEENHLNPVSLMFRQDTLYVAYVGVARIDLFDRHFDSVGTILLDDPEPVYPTDFFVADSEIFVCDHSKQIIVTYDRSGNFLESYGTMPDNTTRLRPFALTYLGGVLYIADAGQRGVLAISMADTPGITERGEVILKIPADSSHTIGFPSALLITVDGRMVVGDASNGEVTAFTCDGRYMYQFDTIPSGTPAAPKGFAVDKIIDPSLQDTASFDPSGLRSIGRIHMVDARNGKIYMFNPLGKFIASYPKSETLEKPSDIAIDTDSSLIYVAEPVTGRILVFRYGE